MGHNYRAPPARLCKLLGSYRCNLPFAALKLYALPMSPYLWVGRHLKSCTYCTPVTQGGLN